MQLTEQLSQCRLLRIGTGVAGSLAVTGKPSHICHVDGVTVMVSAMRPCHLFRSSNLDGPVRGNDIVVSATCPTVGTVVAVDVRHAEGTARPVGVAVHDDQRNCPHKLPPIMPPAALVKSNSDGRRTTVRFSNSSSCYISFFNKTIINSSITSRICVVNMPASFQ